MPMESYRVTIRLSTGQAVSVTLDAINANEAQAAARTMYPGCEVVSWSRG